MHGKYENIVTEFLIKQIKILFGHGDLGVNLIIYSKFDKFQGPRHISNAR